MTTKPLVSIIVPFFNAAPFFTEAIESVRAQTYDGWELLLVDDSSSDGSTEIAQRYAGRYPEKIRYLAHEGRQNRGQKHNAIWACARRAVTISPFWMRMISSSRTSWRARWGC